MISQGQAGDEACATQSSSRSSSISCIPTSPRAIRSGVYGVSEHTGAHRDGYSDDKCRDVLVRFCSDITRNYNYADGLQLVYEKLREYIGDENLDLSSGVLYELIELPSQFTSDEGAPFRRWKHDHCHRNGDLENGHVPRLGNVVISQVVPTERLRHWREGHTFLNLSGSSAISDGEATKGDSIKRYGIKGRSEWQINHTLYMSSRREGTRVIYCPSPKEFHELSWNYGHGSGGTLVGKKIILEEEKSPPESSAERALDFVMAQPLPRTSRAVITKAIKKLTMNFRNPMNCLALFLVQQKNEIDIRYDHMSWSVLEYESQDAYRNLPDVDSIQGTIYYGQIPNCPVPDGITVSGQFARKFGLITAGENLADLKIVKSMPTAEDLAITRGVEAYKKAGASREDSRWCSPGPETAQLFKDDGGMAYKWLRSQSDLSLYGSYNRPRRWNIQLPGGFDGADDLEEPTYSRYFKDCPNRKEAASCSIDDESDDTSEGYNAVAFRTSHRSQMMPREAGTVSPSKARTLLNQKTASHLDSFGNKAKPEGLRNFRNPPPFLRLVHEVVDVKEPNVGGERTGCSTLNVSDDALTLCNSPDWAFPTPFLLSSVGIHEISNSNTTLKRAIESNLPSIGLSSRAKCALEPATQLQNIKYHPSVKSNTSEPPAVEVKVSKAKRSSKFQKIRERLRRRKDKREKIRTENRKYVHQETLDILEGRTAPIPRHISPPNPAVFYSNALVRMRSQGQFEHDDKLDCVDSKTSVPSAASKPLVEHNITRDLSSDVVNDESSDGSSQIKAPVESHRKKCVDSSVRYQKQFVRRSPVKFCGNVRVPEEDVLNRLDDPFVDSKSTLKPDQQSYKLDNPKYLPNFLSNIQHNKDQSTKASFPVAGLRHNQSTDQFARATKQLETQKANANVPVKESEPNFVLNAILESGDLLSDFSGPEPFAATPGRRQPPDFFQKLTPKHRSPYSFIQSQTLQLIRHQKYVAEMSSPRKTYDPSGIMGNFVPLEALDESTSPSSSVREVKRAENAIFYEQIAKSNPYGTEQTSILRTSHQAVPRHPEFVDFMQPTNLQRSKSMRSSQLHTPLSAMSSAQKPISTDSLLLRGYSSPDIIDVQRAFYDKNPELYYASSPLRLPSFNETPHSPVRSQRLSQSIKKRLPDVPEVDETSAQSTPAGQLTASPLPGKKLFGEGGWLGTSMAAEEVPSAMYTKIKAKPGMMAQVKNAMQEIGRKTDFSPVKMLQNALRKERKEAVVVRTPISLTPAQQAQVYIDLELLITTVANRYLLRETRAGRLTVESAQKTADFWRKKGRDQVIEFQYDQSTQRNLILLNLEVLRFYGVAACNPVQITALIHTWNAAAREMSVRTFCTPDTVIDKHLSFAYMLLELLGAEAVFFMALQEAQGTFKNIVRSVREGQQSRGALCEVQAPSQNSALFTSGKPAVSTSKPLQRSQSFRQSVISSFSRHTGGSSSTKHRT